MTNLALAIVISLVGGANAPPASEATPLADWLEALKAPDATVRREAVQAIGGLGPEAETAVPALVEALRDDDANVRAGAARALGAVGPGARSAIPALIEALSEPGYELTVQDGLPSYVPVWFTVGSALGDIGPAALPDLIAAVDDEDPRVYGGAAEGLHRLGPEAKEAVGPLIKLLKTGDHSARGAAIHALKGIGPAAEAAVPALVEALDHEDFHTQYWACQALREIGPGAKAAVPVLIRLLKEDVASVRRHAAQALGGIGPGIGEPGLEALIAALQDPLDPVREDAAVALGKLGPMAKSAAPALEDALADGPLAARVPGAKSLWLITGQPDPAVGVLIEELDDFNWGYQAAQVLGEIGAPAQKAVPALVERVESDDAEEHVRRAAADAIKQIDPKSLPAKARKREP
jgi:HEAT repeat protein